MSVAVDNYGIQKVFNIRGYEILSTGAKGQLKLSLKKLQESTFTNGQTTVYLDGGRANAHQMSFDHSKTATISGSSAYINDGLLEAQTGTAVSEATVTTIEYEETLSISSDTATATYTPTGTANSQIGYAYIVDANGVVLETLTQGATAATGVFSLAAKILTFNTSDYADGTLVKIVYYPTVTDAKNITQSTTTFSKTYYVVADALLKDCNDQTVLGQIQMPRGKIMGEFEWSLSSSGNPAVHNFTVEALEGCNNEKLWDMYIWDGSDVA